MMYTNIRQATDYVYSFLNNYSGKQEFIEKEEIAEDIMDIIIEQIQEVEFTQDQIKSIEQISEDNYKMDSFLSINIDNYGEILTTAVADFLSDYIDIEQTRVK